MPNVTEAAMAAATSRVSREMIGALNAAWRSRTGQNMRRTTECITGDTQMFADLQSTTPKRTGLSPLPSLRSETDTKSPPRPRLQRSLLRMEKLWKPFLYREDCTAAPQNLSLIHISEPTRLGM